MQKGDRVPDFELPAHDGERVSLSDYAGRWFVLYFYPKDNTSGCTKEAQDFSALKEEFAEEGCSILGVSPDSVDSHRNFRERHNITVKLASDSEKTLMKAAGAWGKKKNYGREYEGVIRSTILVRPDGTAAEVWKKVTVRRKTKKGVVLHAQKVLDKLRELRKGD